MSSDVLSIRRAGTCAGIQQADGEIKWPRKEFTTATSHAVAWAEVEQLKGWHTIRFKWFNEAKELVHDSGEMPLNTTGRYYHSRRVWSKLPIRSAAASLMPGKWRVAIYLDDVLTKTVKFRIVS